MPADVRERYEKLQQNDLPAVGPEANADEEDEDDDGDGDGDEATQSTDTVCVPMFFHWA
jgi:hypothetical protein